MNENDETALAVDVKRELAAKVARGMFQPVARHLRTDIAEDRLAEGIAMAFELYAKSVAEGGRAANGKSRRGRTPTTSHSSCRSGRGVRAGGYRSGTHPVVDVQAVVDERLGDRGTVADIGSSGLSI